MTNDVATSDPFGLEHDYGPLDDMTEEELDELALRLAQAEGGIN